MAARAWEREGVSIGARTADGVANEVVQLRGTLAITMGKVILTDANGKTTTVDKTWMFEREPDGTIRIVVHHSSLPFSG